MQILQEWEFALKINITGHIFSLLVLHMNPPVCQMPPQIVRLSKFSGWQTPIRLFSLFLHSRQAVPVKALLLSKAICDMSATESHNDLA